MVYINHLEGGVRCRAAEGSSVGEHAGAAVISVGKVVFQSKLKFYHVQKKIFSLGNSHQILDFESCISIQINVSKSKVLEQRKHFLSGKQASKKLL